jgi:Ras-related protein Rab-8A
VPAYVYNLPAVHKAIAWLDPFPQFFSISSQITSLCSQILVGNKSDMAEERRAVPYSKGKALADEYKIQFFETSAKENINVEEVGQDIGLVVWLPV